MVSTTTKLIVMGALAAVTIVLGSAVLTLTLILNKRKGLLAQRKKIDKSHPPSSSSTTTTTNALSSKTIFPSIAPNATMYNLQYQNYPPHSTDIRTIANTEFAMALRDIEFETKGGYVDGNAYTVPDHLGAGSYKGQNERGAEFVMGKSNKKKKKKRRRGTIQKKQQDVVIGGTTQQEQEQQQSLSSLFNLQELKKYFDNILQNDDDNDSLSAFFTTVASDVLHHITSFTKERTAEDSYLTSSSSSSKGGGGDSNSITKRLTQAKHKTAITAMRHLEKASELGHSSAQNMIAITLASGIFPVDNHPTIRTFDNTTTELNVPADFSEGGDQLARALTLWHLSAMDGNIEAAMALGYRHHFSAMEGMGSSSSSQQRTQISQTQLQSGVVVDDSIVMDDMVHNALRMGNQNSHSYSSQHYGVLGTCESALAYYEAAANGIMDELEQSPLRGKVNPSIDRHRLAEIYMNGGASSALSLHNKPDELEEALQYYRMRASRTAHPQPDVNAAYTLANFYHYGMRGARQDMRLALKYYEIAADFGSWEAAGQAGKFHLWSIGMEEEERDLGKAYRYFKMGTPGGLSGCRRRFEKKAMKLKQQHQHAQKVVKKMSHGKDGGGGGGNGGDDDDDDDDDDDAVAKMPWEEVEMEDEDEEDSGPLCDHPCANGMGLLNLFGVPMVMPVNVEAAKKWFKLAKDMGNMDASYNLGKVHLGWMAGAPMVKDGDEKQMNNDEDGTIDRMKEKFAKEDSFTDDKEYGKEEDDYDHRSDGEGNADEKKRAKKIVDDFDAIDEEIAKREGRFVSGSNHQKSKENDYSTTTTTTKSNLLAEPTKADYAVAIQEFTRAASKGHIQAKHRLGMMFARGVQSVHQRNTVLQQKVVAVPQNCPLALRYYKDVVDSGTTIARRTRVAYKQYMNGNMEDSLRNYMAVAETGSEIGQVNAAFLLESGYCLGMDQELCMKASLRYWRAAARQGNEEACLRVGDFYYYGRINAATSAQGGEIGEKDGKSPEIGRGTNVTPGPFSWMRYVLYPEELIPLLRLKAVQGVRWLLSVSTSIGQPPSTPVLSCGAGEKNQNGVCLAEAEDEKASPPTGSKSSSTHYGEKDDNHHHFAIAADYYRMAAEEHGSSRANFNLGFMHEWGLGLTQDFPLAKRHYDLAAASQANEAGIAVQIALMSMNAHEKMVKYRLLWDEWRKNEAPKEGLWSIFSLPDEEATTDSDLPDEATMMDLILSELFSGESFLILLLTFILFGLIGYQRQR